MEILKPILQFDMTTRIALGALAVTTILWLLSMIAALFTRNPKKSGFRRREIAVLTLSLLFVGTLTWAGRAMEAKPEPEAETPPPAATVSGGGTGTCASVRTGMSIKQVKTLLGTPSLDESGENTRGPGARVMVFDDSRCVVHFLHGAVDQIE